MQPTTEQLCKDCNGTGVDKAKTRDLRDRGIIDDKAKARCWSCNGNGLDPAAFFRPYDKRQQEAR